MTSSKEIKIFTTDNCPRCDKLKGFLSELGADYDEEDMADPDSRAELAMNDVFVTSAPVLKVRESFFTINDIFDEVSLDEEKVEEALKEEDILE